MHIWTEGETEELLRAAVMCADWWGHPSICGVETCPLEPDAAKAWSEHCYRVVKLEGLHSLGFVYPDLVE